MSEIHLYQPQAGPQTVFHACSADIAIYGGGAGGGKTHAVLGEPFYHYDHPKFGAVVFRRTSAEITNVGGLKDKATEIYNRANARPRDLSFYFPAGGHVQLSGMEHDKDRLKWQGTELDLIEWDELTHFSAAQFWYVTLSRGRSTSGIQPYTRATCNPDPDSFVRVLIDWWIGPDGYPIPSRSGKVRAFVRHADDTLEWFDSKKDAHKKYGPHVRPLTLCFIPSLVTDNKILMDINPAYYANLLNLPLVDRERLLRGNWNIRPTPGNYFRREWCEVVPAIRGGWSKQIRFWDRAGTKPSGTSDNPDWTRGIKMAAYPDGTYAINDMRSDRETPGNIRKLIKNTATQDGYGCIQGAMQDPGSAGKDEILTFHQLLSGYQTVSHPHVKGDGKITRCGGFSSACQAGNVKIVKAEWNEALFRELEAFPPGPGGHDDIMDACSGAYNELTGSPVLTEDVIQRMGRVMTSK